MFFQLFFHSIRRFYLGSCVSDHWSLVDVASPGRVAVAEFCEADESIVGNSPAENMRKRPPPTGF